MFLGIVDLDGVICDNTRRFEKAEEAKQAFLKDSESKLEAILSGGSFTKEAVNLYWQTAFTPELVALDTLIEGAIDALAYLAFRGFEMMILTSRPESMRKATRNWLFEKGYPVDEPLIMKAPAFQFVKTVTWKAGMVQTLHRLYETRELLFIDDEEANRKSILDALPSGGDFGIVRVYARLADAVEALKREGQE